MQEPAIQEVGARTKVTQLTSMNMAAIVALGLAVETGKTIAVFAGDRVAALQTVRDGIANGGKGHAPSLHTVRRKLEDPASSCVKVLDGQVAE